MWPLFLCQYLANVEGLWVLSCKKWFLKRDRWLCAIQGNKAGSFVLWHDIPAWLSTYSGSTEFNVMNTGLKLGDVRNDVPLSFFIATRKPISRPVLRSRALPWSPHMALFADVFNIIPLLSSAHEFALFALVWWKNFAMKKAYQNIGQSREFIGTEKNPLSKHIQREKTVKWHQW